MAARPFAVISPPPDEEDIHGHEQGGYHHNSPDDYSEEHHRCPPFPSSKYRRLSHTIPKSRPSSKPNRAKNIHIIFPFYVSFISSFLSAGHGLPYERVTRHVRMNSSSTLTSAPTASAIADNSSIPTLYLPSSMFLTVALHIHARSATSPKVSP